MNFFLFGFKSSGKTHFGKLLSLELKCPFIDTDDLLLELYAKESGHHKSIRDIHRSLGEERFRAFESRVLHLLKPLQRTLVALGGGAMLDPKNVEFLQEIGTLIYLKTPVEKLRERLLRNELPSFLDPKDPEGSFHRMIQEREPIYRSIPARVVDTGLLDEAGVLAALRSIVLLEDN